MDSSTLNLYERVKRRLSIYLKQHPAACLPLEYTAACQELEQLCARNFASGRFERYRRHARVTVELTRTDYLDHLIAVWAREAPFYHRLETGDDAAWSELRRALMQVAAPMLSGFQPLDTAEDYAQRACVQILNAVYPFDVPFLWWACTIVQRLIYARGRSKDRFNDHTVSLDGLCHLDRQAIPLEWMLSDPVAQALFEAVDDRESLLRLLACLNPQRRLVLVLSYFEEWDDEMIANTLGMKQANVQTIRHRALDQLAEFLGKKPVSVNGQRRHRIDFMRNNF